MLKNYKKDLEYFLKNHIYMICMLAIAVLAYGFSATNITVGIDDLECDRYIGEKNELLAAGRFSWLIWTKIFGMQDRYVENNFVFEVAGVICLIWAAVNFCILFRKIVCEKISYVSYTIFSCILISYPLMNEIWEYTGVNIVICANVLLVSFAMLLMREQLCTKRSFMHYGISAIMLMIVCAGYESVIAVYIFMVFATLFLQVLVGKNWETFQSIVKQGSFYASALAVGFALRVVVHKTLLTILNISLMSNGDTSIWWGKLPVSQIVSDILRGIIKDYVVKGIIYFPITELVCCVILFVIICLVLLKKRVNKWVLLPAVGMLVSLVLMTLLQGRASPYRTCQVFAIFVAFVMMLISFMIFDSENQRNKRFHVLFIAVAALVCMHQASTMNYYLTMNHLRSEEEAKVIQEIGQELTSKYDLEKPIIFTGTFDLSDDLKERVRVGKEDVRWKMYSNVYGLFSDKDIYNDNDERKLPDTNVNSVIKWGMTAFGSQDGLWKLFKYHGFDYKPALFSMKVEAEEFVEKEQIPNYPKEGYIFEREDYIIVNMQ